MIHPKTQISIISESIGYGVRATAAIPKGTIVFVEDVLVRRISPEEYETLSSGLKSLTKHYSYRDAYGSWVLSWDHVKYVNHSCNCNTMSTGYGFDIAIRNIADGEEITVEYGLLNIDEDEEMDLLCGCHNCRGRLRVTDFDQYWQQWDTLTQAAMKLIPNVDQPLWHLIDNSVRMRIDNAVKGLEPFPSVRELKMPDSI